VNDPGNVLFQNMCYNCDYENFKVKGHRGQWLFVTWSQFLIHMVRWQISKETSFVIMYLMLNPTEHKLQGFKDNLFCMVFCMLYADYEIVIIEGF
jgi:hypothetical protein